LNLTNPNSKILDGFATTISNFEPTFISVIMAGKMGSFITSIGTMRVTEQIDALEVM
jgi:phospholipid/cholesterol/gamma-HCH transport system permease protein